MRQRKKHGRIDEDRWCQMVADRLGHRLPQLTTEERGARKKDRAIHREQERLARVEKYVSSLGGGETVQIIATPSPDAHCRRCGESLTPYVRRPCDPLTDRRRLCDGCDHWMRTQRRQWYVGRFPHQEKK